MPARLSTGIETYVERAGAGDPALVFLHGGGGWAEHWRLQFDRFAELTTVLMPDLRGHGRSDAPPGRYALETFADDVAALLEDQDIERPLLVGHSLGGPSLSGMLSTTRIGSPASSSSIPAAERTIRGVLVGADSLWTVSAIGMV